MKYKRKIKLSSKNEKLTQEFSPSKTLLVFDICSIFVYSNVKLLPNRKIDYQWESIFCYKRPYIEDFMELLSDHFLVGAWSLYYASRLKKIMKRTMPKELNWEFIWGKEQCTYKPSKHIYDSKKIWKGEYWDRDAVTSKITIKPLSKLVDIGYPIEKILVIGGKQFLEEKYYANIITPKPFRLNGENYDNKYDNELLQLGEYLLSIKDELDVRKITKDYPITQL
ncbi:MAG: NIF family HAD-type phosphatase [Bacteroidota bacterium]